MDRTALSRRIRRAVDHAEREDPDGPLSSYAWMWRALVRSSPSRFGLYLRFTRLVLTDAVLVVAWSAFTPLRRLLRSRLGWVSVGGSAALVVSLLFLGGPTEYPPAPWDGPPTIEVLANGILRFEGQAVTDDQARVILGHYGVKQVTIEIDGETRVSRVSEVNDLLSDAGVEWANAREVIGPAA